MRVYEHHPRQEGLLLLPSASLCLECLQTARDEVGQSPRRLTLTVFCLSIVKEKLLLLQMGLLWFAYIYMLCLEIPFNLNVAAGLKIFPKAVRVQFSIFISIPAAYSQGGHWPHQSLLIPWGDTQHSENQGLCTVSVSVSLVSGLGVMD